MLHLIFHTKYLKNRQRPCINPRFLSFSQLLPTKTRARARALTSSHVLHLEDRIRTSARRFDPLRFDRVASGVNATPRSTDHCLLLTCTVRDCVGNDESLMRVCPTSPLNFDDCPLWYSNRLGSSRMFPLFFTTPRRGKRGSNERLS